MLARNNVRRGASLIEQRFLVNAVVASHCANCSVYSMDDAAYDEGNTSVNAGLDDIRARLTARYRPDLPPGALLSPIDAVNLVSLAARGPSDERPDPTEQDLADALLLVTAAREELIRHIELVELTLTEALRAQPGWTWDRIGSLRGYPQASARQATSSRYQKLRRRFPTFSPRQPR